MGYRRPGEYITIVRASRDDDRYPNTVRLRDGLSVKLKDTDDDPVDADVEIRLNGRRLGNKLKDLPVGSIISVVASYGQEYEIVLTDIHDDSETVTFGLRRRQ